MNSSPSNPRILYCLTVVARTIEYVNLIIYHSMGFEIWTLNRQLLCCFRLFIQNYFPSPAESALR